MSKSAYDIILYPLFTEKSTELRATLNKFSLVVDRRANKIEIKKAVEDAFPDAKGNIVSVRTQNVRGKVKRFGRFTGKRPNWKKAIVTLKDGASIEFFEG